MSKTIKQIADEINLDKQKVYRFIKSNHIIEAQQSNGVMYYDEVAESTIKRCLLEKATSSEVHQNHIKEAVNDVVNEAIISILNKELDTKNQQLEVQNEIIKELQSELAIERLHSRGQSDKLVQLADQAQQLQLADRKSVV